MAKGPTEFWLHGTPATDGCVVLANPDLQRIIRTVWLRTPDFTSNGKMLAQ